MRAPYHRLATVGLSEEIHEALSQCAQGRRIDLELFHEDALFFGGGLDGVEAVIVSAEGLRHLGHVLSGLYETLPVFLVTEDGGYLGTEDEIDPSTLTGVTILNLDDFRSNLASALGIIESAC